MKDNHFLKLALKQAKIRQGFCFPNPSVGCIIVDAQQNIISKGYHYGAGHHHAEVDAITKAGTNLPTGCTIYITLEPCCHWGRTPPCTDAIIKSGIKRVVYAFKDPNPVVSGKSSALLQSADIECEQITIDEINEFYEPYLHWHQTKLPYVTAKIALSLNGAIAHASGSPAEITGAVLKKFTHQSRKSADAILTSIDTILCDDPQFNVRIGKKVIAKPIYIIDSNLKLPLNIKLFKTAKSLTIFHAKNANTSKLEQLRNLGVKCYEVEKTHEGLNLESILEIIGTDGVHHLWLEAGGKLFSSFVNNKLLQHAYIYVALHWLNHGKIAFPAGISLTENPRKIQWRQYGNDVLCEIHF